MHLMTFVRMSDGCSTLLPPFHVGMPGCLHGHAYRSGSRISGFNSSEKSVRNHTILEVNTRLYPKIWWPATLCPRMPTRCWRTSRHSSGTAVITTVLDLWNTSVSFCEVKDVLDILGLSNECLPLPLRCEKMPIDAGNIHQFPQILLFPCYTV